MPATAARTRGKILLVDDDPGLLRLLSIRLRAEGYEIEAVDSAHKALGALNRFTPDLVITDLRMDKMDGIGLLKELQMRSPGLRVVIITAHGTIPDAVVATQSGAFGFLTKPIDKDELMATVDRALKVSGSVEVDEDWCKQIITRNQHMKEILQQAKMVAATDARVMLNGESGTGKELLAQAIHRASPRRDKPFVAINCSAMAENLLESELFGHEKGSFTGATRNHKGLFQAAEGGTLLLDEIGDMNPMTQAKLLRVLEEQEMTRIGGEQVIKLDVRIFSSTNRDLDRLLAGGKFREDLFHRLQVIPIHVLPLRERRGDISLLAEHFFSRFCRSGGIGPKRLTAAAADVLNRYSWPGNVRELRNLCERLVIMTDGQTIDLPHVEPLIAHVKMGKDKDVLGPAAPVAGLSLAEQMLAYERRLVAAAVERNQGNISAAARELGLDRANLFRKLKRLGLKA